MWWALDSQKYRHLPTSVHIGERVVEFNKFREKVIGDRADNEEAAAQGRHPQPADNDDSGEDDDDEDEMDPKLY